MRRTRIVIPLALLMSVLGASLARADLTWSEGAFPYRRAIDVDYDLAKTTGAELATVSFYTAGHHQEPDPGVRVTTEEGRIVPSQVLMTGPGDQLRIVFAVSPPIKRYYAYFGNPKPPPAPRGADVVSFRCGLLMEMHASSVPLANNFKQIETAWSRRGQVIGRMIYGRLFLGLNPFGPESNYITRFSGSLNIPADGEYTFAGSARDRGALYLDEKPLLFIPASPPDTRFNVKATLTRGHHDIIFYHQSASTEQRLSVVWQRPGAARFEIIQEESFGVPPKATAGALEQKASGMTADMKIEYMGEFFFNDHFTHRYRFTTQPAPPPGNTSSRQDWDLGDGQTATGPVVEHVYLTEGLRPVKLTVRVGSRSDTQTNRLAVSRRYERLDQPPTDLASPQVAAVSAYDPAKIAPQELPWAVLLMARTRQLAPLEKFALQLAKTTDQVPAALAMTALDAAAGELTADARFDSAAILWQSVPKESALQPGATLRFAQILTWRLAEFPKALSSLDAQLTRNPKDKALQRARAHVLLLTGKSNDARAALLAMAPESPPEKQAALTGALARTIEFYITEGDWESGEQSWDKWQQQYPADFLEGYSVLLKTQLMEKAKSPLAAAKVAEAFALAVPRSPYAPRLLDRAAALLDRFDPSRAVALRQLLREKYPEDPLSQRPAPPPARPPSRGPARP